MRVVLIHLAVTSILCMFDRYTEKARRVIFHAREQTSEFGASQIETEHILLGVLRADSSLVYRLLPGGTNYESIRREIEAVTPVRN